ncbi:MAG: hypothetical protein ABW007_18695 [Chitinophagaceae bacterium]
MISQSSATGKFLVTLSFIAASTQVSIAQLGTGIKINTNTPATIENVKASGATKVSITKSDGSSENVYKTLNIIQYNYLKARKDSISTVLSTLTDSLYSDSRATPPTFPTQKVETMSNTIRALQAQRSAIQHTQDSLYHEYVKEIIRYRNYIAFPGTQRAQAFFDLAYGTKSQQFRALNNAGISFGNNSGSLYSEIVSGTLAAIRVSLGAMVASSQSDNDTEEKNEEAYQRLVNYGGNTVLTLEYPWLYAHTNNNQFNLLSRFLLKGTGDLPAFGTNTDAWAGSGSLGLDLYADAATSNGEIKFFCNFNLNRIYGTETFRENLGIDKANFSFGQLTVGLIFMQNFKLSFVVSTFSSEESLRNRKVIAGGQVLR